MYIMMKSACIKNDLPTCQHAWLPYLQDLSCSLLLSVWQCDKFYGIGPFATV